MKRPEFQGSVKEGEGDFTVARSVFRIDPVCDPRWSLFLKRHPEASVFHTPEWLSVLRRTYAYQPIAFTTSPPGRPLENGIVFCRVDSWLTGSRLVSLPFSDHCEPLVESHEDWAVLSCCLQQELTDKWYRYVELRALVAREVGPVPFEKAREYFYHRLNLRPTLEMLFRSFHKSCIQRKIERAQREGLTYEAGRSESILAKFYRLQLLTRRRHRLPPQPLAWFRNLLNCFGDKVTIRVLSKEGQPVASILTLSYKNTLVYKYGCSDSAFHNLGGIPLLFWKAIQEGKQQCAEDFDLGRSETDNPGLTIFKERLGATCSKLLYFRLGEREPNGISSGGQMQIFRRVVGRMPDSIAQIVGSALYRHMG